MRNVTASESMIWVRQKCQKSKPIYKKQNSDEGNEKKVSKVMIHRPRVCWYVIIIFEKLEKSSKSGEREKYEAYD